MFSAETEQFFHCQVPCSAHNASYSSFYWGFSALESKFHSLLMWTELWSEKGFAQQQEGCNCSYSIRERYARASWVNEILRVCYKVSVTASHFEMSPSVGSCWDGSEGVLLSITLHSWHILPCSLTFLWHARSWSLQAPKIMDDRFGPNLWCMKCLHKFHWKKKK